MNRISVALSMYFFWVGAAAYYYMLHKNYMFAAERVKFYTSRIVFLHSKIIPLTTSVPQLEQFYREEIEFCVRVVYHYKRSVPLFLHKYYGVANEC